MGGRGDRRNACVPWIPTEDDGVNKCTYLRYMTWAVVLRRSARNAFQIMSASSTRPLRSSKSACATRRRSLPGITFHVTLRYGTPTRGVVPRKISQERGKKSGYKVRTCLVEKMRENQSDATIILTRVGSTRLRSTTTDWVTRTSKGRY